ncbi:MAG: hypothetical protein IH623_10475 [Verrucomicrobia bacterium]|nr:hypothetical protein [Verrucomicrobiota bacterium]
MTWQLSLNAAGGLALFLLAMLMMTEGLKTFADGALKQLLSQWTSTPLRGVFSGILVTGVGNELDLPNQEIIAVAEGRWKVGGGVSLGALAQKTGVPLPAATPDAALSDWLTRQLRKELASGDTWHGGGLTFTVLQIRRRRAHRVLVERASRTVERTLPVLPSHDADAAHQGGKDSHSKGGSR